jgi:TnpA family transposase
MPHAVRGRDPGGVRARTGGRGRRLEAHCGPRNHIYRAVRELGRVYKTLFFLEYLTDPALRWRVRCGPLKGEQLHALARQVHYGKQG